MKRERRRIGAAHVLYIGVGEQQLIGNLIGEAAVQICRPRLHLVVHGIHAVGKRHRLRTYAISIVQAISRIGRVTVRGIPSRILRIVVAEAQAMAVRDVRVDAGQNLGVLLVSRKTCVRACVVAVLVLPDGCTPSPYPTSAYGTPYLLPLHRPHARDTL